METYSFGIAGRAIHARVTSTDGRWAALTIYRGNEIVSQRIGLTVARARALAFRFVRRFA